MIIRLIKSQVISLTIKKRKGKSKDRETSFDLRYSIGYDEVKDDIFYVTFQAKIAVPNELTIDVTYISTFKTSEPIDEAFRQSHFPIVNAPAIAFPFFRAYISFLSLNSGYEPIMLSSINFTKFKNPQSVQQSGEPKAIQPKAIQ